MKKIFAVFLAIFAMAYFSMPAFADTLTMGSGTNSTSVELSKNVTAKYNGATDGSSYAAVTYNSNGTGKTYGTSSDTTYIYYADDDKVSDFAKTDSSDFTSGDWKQLGE